MSKLPKRRPHLPKQDEDYETCPDCSDRDAVSLTFGHTTHSVKKLIAAREAVISFGRRERGVSLVASCETCGGTGVVVTSCVRKQFVPRRSLPGLRPKAE